MNVTPIRDNVLIKRSEDESKTSSGLFVVQTEKPSSGTVVAVGEGALTFNGTLIPMKVKVGDTVLFVKGAGAEVKIKDETFVLLTERDIFAILHDE